MRIESIFLRNYRVFRTAELTDLPSMATVVGANGSGKSTLFDALSFLKEALNENVAEAVERRGGFRELVSRGESGPISIILHLVGCSGFPEAYRVDIVQEHDRPVVQRELFAVYERSRDENPSTHFIDVSRGVGVIATDEFAEAEQPIELENPNALAIKGLGQFKQYQAVAELSELLENWHVSDLHVQEARTSSDAGFAEHLSARGDNLAQVALFLFEHHRDRFDRILAVMRARVPGVTSIEAKRTLDGRLVLRLQDGSFKDPFVARHVSDGTIRMFAYLVLLHDPKPHPLLAVEEPENQLYPALLRELAEEFRDYARRGGQVFVSTHSPEFLNGVKLDEIYWLVKEDGFATVRRASESKLLRDLYAEGDLPGALWKQRFFEGVDPE